jgi:capsular polysaccharide biosynthesis protein
MAAMRFVRRPCLPGSALYLSRKGQRSEGRQRSVNNEVTEPAMEACGVKVVRTSGLGPDDYIKLAEHAETLFFDHGSAGDNLMHWQTRRVVELFLPRPNYWDPSFLFLSDCLRIHDYHLWEIRPETTMDALARRIEALRSQPIAES